MSGYAPIPDSSGTIFLIIISAIGLLILFCLAWASDNEPKEFKEMKRLIKIQEKEDERIRRNMKTCHWCGFEYDKRLEVCPACDGKS